MLYGHKRMYSRWHEGNRLISGSAYAAESGGHVRQRHSPCFRPSSGCSPEPYYGIRSFGAIVKMAFSSFLSSLNKITLPYSVDSA